MIRPLTLLFAAALLVAGCDPVAEAPSSQKSAPAGNFSVELTALKVANQRPMTGYSRDRFPHWRKTGSNCDVRDAVLERDGKNIKKTGCNVTAGSWFSVYDGQTYTDLTKVDIDHMVPLANAWRSGADSWTDDKRSDFANDMTRPQLRAVSASANRSKGDQDPSTWKPTAKDFWCTYAQEWITVKTYWKLTVTAAEKSALTDMLATCV